MKISFFCGEHDLVLRSFCRQAKKILNGYEDNNNEEYQINLSLHNENFARNRVTSFLSMCDFLFARIYILLPCLSSPFYKIVKN
jgi:hypothetical protein